MILSLFFRQEDAIDINESLADAYQVTSTYLFEIIMKVSKLHVSFTM